MAQPFRAPRRQSDSVLAVDLVTPTRGQSVSQSSYQKRSRASEQPVAARPTKKKRDDGLWPTAEESYFIELLKQDNDARNAGQTMLQGEARFTRMAVKINERFHNQEPTKYRKKEWKQIRSKETNLRALCKEILGKVYGATKAKTVTGAATGPSGEIIQEGEGVQHVLSTGPERFTHPDQVGDEEIDLGDAEWANFAQYCDNVREAGDGRKYSSHHSTGFDSDLDGDLEDDGESPPTKTKAKKTPGQSRVTTKDHTVSTFMHAFQEFERMARLDAQEERAHQRKQEDRRYADKAADRAQIADILRTMMTVFAASAGVAPAGHAAAAAPRPLQPGAFHPQAAVARPQPAGLYPQAHVPPSAQFVTAAQPRPAPVTVAAALQPQPAAAAAAAPQPQPAVVTAAVVPQPQPAAAAPQPQPAAMTVAAASQAVVSAPPTMQPGASQSSLASAATGADKQPSAVIRIVSQRERRPPAAHKDFGV